MMEITYGDQTIDFKCPDKVLLSLSGGLDSASLFFLICFHFPDTEIVPYTGHDVTAPMDYECAKDIIQYMRETFPTVNIRDHDVYTFDIMDPEWREYAASKREEEKITLPDGTKIDRCPKLSGLVKILMLRKNTARLREQYPEHWILTGMTANPPVEEQYKYNFYNLAERRRDDKEQSPWYTNSQMYQPYVNVDKKFVAGVYRFHNLMDVLYPFTSSCVGSERDTEYFTKGCGKCFWCNEKKWAFET